MREATVHHSINDEYGLRQGDWRQKNAFNPHDQPAELFHLKEDLKETTNLYAQYPDRVKEMHALLERAQVLGLRPANSFGSPQHAKQPQHHHQSAIHPQHCIVRLIGLVLGCQ